MHQGFRDNAATRPKDEISFARRCPLQESACRCIAALLLLAAASAQAQPITHIEPPNWWVGMKGESLQLLVHGPRIAERTPELNYPGVRIDTVTRTVNPNYLFITLHLAPDTKPGMVNLGLRAGKDLLAAPYELKAREPGSANRQGFGPKDVILNLMPDRFANGNPANDNQAGYGDPVNRQDPNGRHGGDIQGIADHLDHIAAMGYTMIWPTPLLDNKMARYSYHGYAATDYYRVDPRFGTNEDYRQLVIKARAKGIGVIQDMVPNHIGSGHWWMADLPAPDWLSNGNQFTPTNHARTTASDPYAAAADKEGFTGGWFEKSMPDVNQRNPLVAAYEIQNALWWIEYAGLSGLRVDTYGYADKAFSAAWAKRVMAEYPKLNIVGEEWSLNPVVVSYWLRGRTPLDGYESGLPSAMDFPLQDTLLKALVEPDGWPSALHNLYEALVNDRLYPAPQNLVLFEGNHDMPRLFSMLNDDPALWRMALAYVATARRIPQIYYGTEVLMSSPKTRDDGAVRQDFPGGWAGDAVNAFTGAGLSEAQKDAQAFVKRLLTWRKTAAVIHRGRLMHFQPQNGVYVYFRYEGQQRVMVVLNKNSAEQQLATARFREILPALISGTDILTGHRVDIGATLTVPARSAMVIELEAASIN